MTLKSMVKRCLISVFKGVVVLSLLLPAGVRTAAAAVGDTTRVSIASDGTQGNNYSESPSISVDGRYVAFSSWASNLVDGDTNGDNDVFVHDRQWDTTTRVSVASDGTQGNDGSYSPSISADGRYVTFVSDASNLVNGDTIFYNDVFVHDQQTGTTTLVSVASDGTLGNEGSSYPSISADGRYVTFVSDASNLVSGDTNEYRDVFIHDRQTNITTRVSVASDGTQGNNGSSYPSISADGRYVAFSSIASNLVSEDSNGKEDVFIHDRQTGVTTRVSVSSNGTEGNEASLRPSISADGRYVAFESRANDLVDVDFNGERDVFVHDQQTGVMTLVSVNNNLIPGNFASDLAVISADGRYVAFRSDADNLVSGDTNFKRDIFVRNLQKGVTTRVSVADNGAQGNNASLSPSISGDGQYVTFQSTASNLVSGDTNGVEDIFVHDTSSAISGHIQDVDGSPISGVTVSAGSGYSTTTDASGNYTFSNLPPGVYTITPLISDYAFSPSSRSVTVPPDATGINFIGVPPPPILVSPMDGSTVTTWTPTYTWNDVPEATHFKLYLGNPDYSMIFAQWYTRTQANCDGSTCHVTPDTAITGGENRWCVKSYNNGGSWSSWWSFTSPSVVSKPTLVSPADGETLTTFTPTYIWNEDSAATHYELWIGRPDGTLFFTQWYTTVDANCSGGACAVTPDITLSVGQYRWFVKSSNPGSGAWSDGWSFTSPAAVSKPTLISPIEDETLTTFTPTYTWYKDSAATHYKMWIGRPDGTLLFTQWYTPTEANCTGATCAVTPDLTLSAGQYRWFVKSSNPGGSAWSDGVTFNAPPAAGKPLLISPTGSISETKPTYTWHDGNDASNYKLYVRAPDGSVVWAQWYTSVEANCDGDTCSVTPDVVLSQSGQYTWYVKAYNPAGGAWSDPMNFTR